MKLRLNERTRTISRLYLVFYVGLEVQSEPISYEIDLSSIIDQ